MLPSASVRALALLPLFFFVAALETLCPPQARPNPPMAPPLHPSVRHLNFQFQFICHDVLEIPRCKQLSSRCSLPADPTSSRPRTVRRVSRFFVFSHKGHLLNLLVSTVPQAFCKFEIFRTGTRAQRSLPSAQTIPIAFKKPSTSGKRKSTQKQKKHNLSWRRAGLRTVQTDQITQVAEACEMYLEAYTLHCVSEVVFPCAQEK